MLLLIKWILPCRFMLCRCDLLQHRLKTERSYFYSTTSHNGRSQHMNDHLGNEKEEKVASSVLEASNNKQPLESLEEPTTCCMSGCANCVWLEYAEKMTEYYKDGGQKSIKEINEKITDPNIKAYLLHEIRMRMK